MRTIFLCQTIYRWNCTEKTLIKQERPQFYDLLGTTVRAGNREAGFVMALSSAGIVYSITKGCRAGNISECHCDSQDHSGQHLDENEFNENNGLNEAKKLKYSWSGCSDNINYAVEFAKRFFDSYEQKQFQETKNIRHLINLHNYRVGREVVSQNMQKRCRCHGISGSCDFQTCWMETPELQQIGSMLKDRYNRFSVQVAKKVKKKLRRKGRTEIRKTPLRFYEIAYINKSPNYCDRDDKKGILFFEGYWWYTIVNKQEKKKKIMIDVDSFCRQKISGILGTTGRQCNQTMSSPSSCTLLCCGRGYRSIEGERTENCYCKFFYCCMVKCKLCLIKYVNHICK
ncbi:unnamed protein product [Enterobius vermicularis]|uniref:Protein Wnt n=1 Tax=Enterobius vermicularis TaxID=51028 RepID=A0A0N4VGI9_ENTVE|nr:unnamed protein product [Enterobius vermicularis]